MKVLVLCFFIACTSASPVWPIVGYPASFSSKYHAQDELGQAAYGYAYPGQAATNFRDAFGNQVGSYAYINAEGKQVQVSYTADHRGFRVLSNDLPVAPVDEGIAPVFEGKAPEPVQDTPEVVAAKAEHFRLKEEAAAAAVAPVIEEEDVVQVADVPIVEDAPVADIPAAEEKPLVEEVVPEVVVKEVGADAPVVEGKPDPALVNDAAYVVGEEKPLVEKVVPEVAIKEEGADTPAVEVYDAPVVQKDPVAVAPLAEEKPVADGLVEVAVDRKKRQVPILPYTSAVYGTALSAPWGVPARLIAPAPLVTKTTLKTVTAEADLTAKTPADTNKFELKEKSVDVVTPLAYHNAYAYTYPNAYPYLNGLYGYY